MASVPHSDARTSYLLNLATDEVSQSARFTQRKRLILEAGWRGKKLRGGTRWMDNANLLIRRSVLPRRQPVCCTTITTTTTCIMSRATTSRHDTTARYLKQKKKI